MAPFPHAVPVLTRLAEEMPLLFVTARDRRRPIEHWLHRHLAPVPPAAIRVLATGDPDTKIHYLKDHGIHYFVEDRLETCLQLADHGITPILFAQPWNRQPHPFIEVADWPELAGLLFEEEENFGGGAKGRQPLPPPPNPYPQSLTGGWEGSCEERAGTLTNTSPGPPLKPSFSPNIQDKIAP